MAHLLADLSLYDESIELYKTAIHLASTNIHRAKISADLGWVLFEAGQLSSGEESSLSLVADEASGSERLLIEGTSTALLAHCAWSRDPDRAAEYARLAVDSLRQFIDREPEAATVGFAYGLAARAQLLFDNTENAILLTAKCLESNLSDRDRQACLTLRAEALRRANRLDEAEEMLKEAIRYSKTDKNALLDGYFELGSVQRLNNHLVEAKESFRKAFEIVRMDPQGFSSNDSIAEMHSNMGAVHYDLGEYREGALEYKETIRRCDQNVSLRDNATLWLGHCYYASGNYREARESYLHLLASPQASEEQKGEAQEGVAKTYYYINQGNTSTR